MEITQQTKLSFFGVDIVNFNFSTSTPYDGKALINLSISPQIFFLKDSPGSFKVIFTIDLKADKYFKIGMVAIGSFKIEGEITEPMKKSFLNTNAPAIMFPYVRSFITLFTTNTGTSTTPIILPPHFFNGDIPILTEEEIYKTNTGESKIGGQ